jgi:GNAT superfamily N-acetyltransferase
MTNQEEQRSGNTTVSKVSRDVFVKHITDKKEDRFAKTFVAKADMQDIWDNCYGVFKEDVLLGSIITTISKTKPKTMNLQLLHTFHSSRGLGVGKTLCNWALEKAVESGVEYFRVSAEPDAVVFYEKCGFKFLGKQKSGSQLSLFRVNGNRFEDGDYDINDPFILKSVYRKGKGGCVEVFVKPVSSSLENFLC